MPISKASTLSVFVQTACSSQATRYYKIVILKPDLNKALPKTSSLQRKRVFLSITSTYATHPAAPVFHLELLQSVPNSRESSSTPITPAKRADNAWRFTELLSNSVRRPPVPGQQPRETQERPPRAEPGPARPAAPRRKPRGERRKRCEAGDAPRTLSPLSPTPAILAAPGWPQDRAPLPARRARQCPWAAATEHPLRAAAHPHLAGQAPICGRGRSCPLSGDRPGGRGSGGGSGARPLPGAGPAPAAASALLFLRRQDGGAARGRPSSLRRAPPSHPPLHWLGAHGRALIGRRGRRCCQGSGAGSGGSGGRGARPHPGLAFHGEHGQRPAERGQRAQPRSARQTHGTASARAGRGSKLGDAAPRHARAGACPVHLPDLGIPPPQAAAAMDRALRNFPSVPAWKPSVPWFVTHAVSWDGRRARLRGSSTASAEPWSTAASRGCVPELAAHPLLRFCTPKISTQSPGGSPHSVLPRMTFSGQCLMFKMQPQSSRFECKAMNCG